MKIIQLIILIQLSLFALGQNSEHKNDLIKNINSLQEQNGNEKFLYNFNLEDKFRAVLKTQNIENLSLIEKRRLLVSNRIYDYDFIIEKLDSTLSEQAAIEKFYKNYQKEINQIKYNNIALLSVNETNANASFVILTKHLVNFNTYAEATYVFDENATEPTPGKVINITLKGQTDLKKMLGYPSYQLKDTIFPPSDHIDILTDINGCFQIIIDQFKYPDQKYLLICDEQGNIISNIEF